VRRGLARRGLVIPADTWFIGALHDTCVDEVTIHDKDRLPAHYAEELAQLRSWLKQAGELTRLQRAARLGLDNLSLRAVTNNVKHRSRDWAQVHPEWALAGCAAFIAAPRQGTRGLNLGGRTFLHDYQWEQDEGFGVLEGNAGDLRVGLPMQSLHDGKQWMHEPMRLSVFVDAPQWAIDEVIAGHDLVRQMLDNAWLHLFRMDDDGGFHRRVPGSGWQQMSREVLAEAA